MWRLLIVLAIALLPLGLSQLMQQTGSRLALDGWSAPPARPLVPRGETPPPEWRERAYLAANPDVAAAVRNGDFTSGYEHYRLAGRDEGRTGGFPATEAVAEIPEP